MEVKGKVYLAQVGEVTTLHFRSETEESYIEVDGMNVRETRPTLDAYRAFVVGLVQSLRQETNRNKEILTKTDRNGTYCS